MAVSSDLSIATLGQDIARLSEIEQNFLTSEAKTTLSFSSTSSEAFPDAPANIGEARRKLIDATKSLHDIILGPTQQLFQECSSYTNLLALNWICHFRIAHHVPLDGHISYENLAAASGVDISRLRRILRQAMLAHVFEEPGPEQVAHSAASRLLATDAGMEALVKVMVDDLNFASTRSVEAYEKYGAHAEPHQSGWNVANNVKDETWYVHWAKNEPSKLENFGKAMERFNGLEGWGVQYLLPAYDWASLSPGSKIVDIGGGLGTASLALAEAFPNLKFIVQDLPQTVEDGRKALPDHLQERIEFMAHDFFTEQPVKDADIYFFQDVLIDYPDHTAAEIVARTTRAMPPGSKILVRDGVLPKPGDWYAADEQNIRTLDLTSFVTTNAGHRDLHGWGKMFHTGNSKLDIERVSRPPGSLYSVMVLSLKA